MSSSIQKTLIQPFDNYYKSTNIVDKQLVSRMAGAINAIAHVAAAITYGVQGTLYAGASFITLGRFVHVNKVAKANLESTGRLIPELFGSTISVLNPKASFRNPKKEGVFSEKLSGRLNKLHNRLLTQIYGNEKVGFVARQIATRSISLIKIPVAIVARVADFALGVLFAAGAIICLGTSSGLNGAAYSHLQLLQVIPDIYQAAIELLNPNAFTHSH